MSGLIFALKSNNNSQDMTLSFDKQSDGHVSICLVGKYEGECMQIDFNEISVREARHLANYINMTADDEVDIT